MITSGATAVCLGWLPGARVVVTSTRTRTCAWLDATGSHRRAAKANGGAPRWTQSAPALSPSRPTVCRDHGLYLSHSRPLFHVRPTPSGRSEPSISYLLCYSFYVNLYPFVPAANACPALLLQEWAEGAVVIYQLFEAHSVKARRRRHHHVGDALYGEAGWTAQAALEVARNHL